ISSFVEQSAVAMHPYSNWESRVKLIEEDQHVNAKDAFGYNIRIVDNSGAYGDRYVNINNQVYRVPVSRNASLKDGVYLTTSRPVGGDYAFCKPVSNHYSFNE